MPLQNSQLTSKILVNVKKNAKNWKLWKIQHLIEQTPNTSSNTFEFAANWFLEVLYVIQILQKSKIKSKKSFHCGNNRILSENLKTLILHPEIGSFFDLFFMFEAECCTEHLKASKLSHFAMLQTRF